MHGTFGHHSRTIPVVICFQGGAALGAFSAGFASEILKQAPVEVIGATGTSVGGVTTHALIAGYIHGLQNGHNALPSTRLEIARLSAAANIEKTWNQLTSFQKNQLPPWYPYINAHLVMMAAGFEHTMNQFVDMYGKYMPSAYHQMGKRLAALPQDMQHLLQHSSNALLSHAKPEVPLLSFYRYAQKHGGVLPIPQGGGSPFADTNATIHREGTNLREATPEQEIVFRLNNLAEHEQFRVIAAGGCLDMFRRVIVGGKSLYDGAYSSAFPDLIGTAKFCAANNYTMLVVRTRPEGAYRLEDHPLESLNGMRAFFNTKPDPDLAFIRQIPDLRLIEVQPDMLEQDTHGLLNIENRFDEESIAQRMQHGRDVARRTMEKEFGIVASQKEVTKRRRASPEKTAAAPSPANAAEFFWQNMAAATAFTGIYLEAARNFTSLGHATATQLIRLAA